MIKVNICSAVFKKYIQTAMKFAEKKSKGEELKFIHTVMFIAEDDQLKITATDKVSLYQASIPAKIKESFTVCIDIESCKDIIKALTGKKEKINFEIDTAEFSFYFHGNRIHGECIPDLSVPNIKQIIPTTFYVEIRVDKKDILNMIDGIKNADYNGKEYKLRNQTIQLVFNKNNIDFYYDKYYIDDKEGGATMRVNINGHDFESYKVIKMSDPEGEFNVTYSSTLLKKIITSIKSCAVVLKFWSSRNPAVFQGIDKNEIYVLMPVRT